MRKGKREKVKKEQKMRKWMDKGEKGGEGVLRPHAGNGYYRIENFLKFSAQRTRDSDSYVSPWLFCCCESSCSSDAVLSARKKIRALDSE